ncbi:MAG: PKD domain-containing protein [Saprospiraceae bacterium]
MPDADIVGWTWILAEGTTDTSSVPSPGYPYGNSGNYTATLTVTAASGCTSSYSEKCICTGSARSTFALPLANCAGNATEFTLGNSAGILETSWEFGDPTSGDLNEGEGGTVYHNYSPAGMYPVTVHAVNNYGCLGSFTQAVDIVDNPFSGIIVPVNAVICEGKTITLIGTAGPSASYVRNGTTLQTLVVDKEGIYDVTLTNGNGCTILRPSGL